jgi:hypothetical protein
MNRRWTWSWGNPFLAFVDSCTQCLPCIKDFNFLDTPPTLKSVSKELDSISSHSTTTTDFQCPSTPPINSLPPPPNFRGMIYRDSVICPGNPSFPVNTNRYRRNEIKEKHTMQSGSFYTTNENTIGTENCCNNITNGQQVLPLCSKEIQNFYKRRDPTSTRTTEPIQIEYLNSKDSRTVYNMRPPNGKSQHIQPINFLKCIPIHSANTLTPTVSRSASPPSDGKTLPNLMRSRNMLQKPYPKFTEEENALGITFDDNKVDEEGADT